MADLLDCFNRTQDAIGLCARFRLDPAELRFAAHEWMQVSDHLFSEPTDPEPGDVYVFPPWRKDDSRLVDLKRLSLLTQALAGWCDIEACHLAAGIHDFGDKLEFVIGWIQDAQRSAENQPDSENETLDLWHLASKSVWRIHFRAEQEFAPPATTHEQNGPATVDTGNVGAAVVATPVVTDHVLPAAPHRKNSTAAATKGKIVKANARHERWKEAARLILHRNSNITQEECAKEILKDERFRQKRPDAVKHWRTIRDVICEVFRK